MLGGEACLILSSKTVARNRIAKKKRGGEEPWALQRRTKEKGHAVSLSCLIWVAWSYQTWLVQRWDALTFISWLESLKFKNFNPEVEWGFFCCLLLSLFSSTLCNIVNANREYNMMAVDLCVISPFRRGGGIIFICSQHKLVKKLYWGISTDQKGSWRTSKPHGRTGTD